MPIQKKHHPGEPLNATVVYFATSFNAFKPEAHDLRALSGMEQFAKELTVHKKLLVGANGIPVEEFITTDVAGWF